MDSKQRIAVALIIFSISATSASADVWKHFSSSKHFSISYPADWFLLGDSTDVLNLGNSGARRFPGFASTAGAIPIISPGPADITVMEAEGTPSETFSQVIAYYTYGASVLSRRDSGESSKQTCRRLEEVVSQPIPVAPNAVSIVNTDFFCEADAHKIVLRLTNLYGDRQQSEYQQVALRMAKSIQIEHGEVVVVDSDEDLIRIEGMRGVKEILGRVGPDNSGGPEITDAGLVHLKNLKELEVIDLSDTLRITDVGLSNLAGLTQLRELKFTFNRNITSAGIEHLRALKKLRVLDFYGAPITDAGLEHIQGLAELEDLQLGLAPITDAGVVYLEHFSKLKTLDLQGTMITDTGLIHLQALRQLEWLSLNETKVTDAGLVSLRGLTNLRTLYLAGTQVTAEGKESLKKALPNLEIRTQK